MNNLNYKNYKSIFILTGAGISADSGIKTFRDYNGLWENYRLEEVASPEGFEMNPKLVLDFYNMRRKQLFEENIKPNAAHHALAKLEQSFSGEFTLVTQNVDNLHERGGSSAPLHMHGSLIEAKCTGCGNVTTIGNEEINVGTACSSCGKQLRPNIVWFGEQPYHLDIIYKKLYKSDLFISIGTSGMVYPASGFIHQARKQNTTVVEINYEKTLQAGKAHYGFYGKAESAVPIFVNQFLSEQINNE